MGNEERTAGAETGTGIAIGVAVGAAFGVVFDDLAIGLALGLALGAAFDGSPSLRRLASRERNADNTSEEQQPPNVST